MLLDLRTNGQVALQGAGRSCHIQCWIDRFPALVFLKLSRGGSSSKGISWQAWAEVRVFCTFGEIRENREGESVSTRTSLAIVSLGAGNQYELFLSHLCSEDCQYLECGFHLSTDINISWYFGFVLYHRFINFAS